MVVFAFCRVAFGVAAAHLSLSLVCAAFVFVHFVRITGTAAVPAARTARCCTARALLRRTHCCCAHALFAYRTTAARAAARAARTARAPHRRAARRARIPRGFLHHAYALCLRTPHTRARAARSSAALRASASLPAARCGAHCALTARRTLHCTRTRRTRLCRVTPAFLIVMRWNPQLFVAPFYHFRITGRFGPSLHLRALLHFTF